ncbi:MAG: porphobilinogen synthase [Proteobacteria bacterium]|nr:porphobilinogen synthase [Pseudomonadota bacterium]
MLNEPPTPVNAAFPALRLRRLRQADWTRRLVRETVLSPADLIWSVVIHDGPDAREAIPSMPGVERLSVAEAVKAAVEARALGIPAVAVFPKVDGGLKDARGSAATHPDNLVVQAVAAMKAAAPEVGIVCDVALDPYTDHGHDGVLERGCVLNDATVERLIEQSLLLASAGADVLAPSDMMDGRIGRIRTALEADGRCDTLILSYAAKYASAFYGPFRDAIGTTGLLKGDKATYQMDPANTHEALREVELDLAEGADMVMIKPGLPYLDIVRRVVERFAVPTFAFQVSGEYAMIKAAGQNGWLDEDRAVLESLLAFKRAGCSGVLTYFARDAARLLSR